VAPGATGGSGAAAASSAPQAVTASASAEEELESAAADRDEDGPDDDGAEPAQPAGAIPTPAPAQPGPALAAGAMMGQGGLGQGVSLIDEAAVGDAVAEFPPPDKDPAAAAKRPPVCSKLLACTWEALKIAREHITSYETTREVIDALGEDAAASCTEDLQVIVDNLTFRALAVPEACR
jgi:hypothetical protein